MTSTGASARTGGAAPGPRAAPGYGRHNGWLLVRPWLAVGLRLVLAAVFAAAGASKLPDPAESVRAVRAYRLLPEAAVHAVAYGLPVLEVALAVLLFLGLVIRLAAVLSAVLLAVFLAGIASVAARGLSIDCGCFGGGGAVAAGDTRYTAELLRDTGLLALALALARWPASPLSLDRWLPDPGPDHDHDPGRPSDPEPDPAPDPPRNSIPFQDGAGTAAAVVGQRQEDL